MDNYELDCNLTFCDAFGYALRAYRSQSPLTVHAANLSLIQQEGAIAECRLTFQALSPSIANERIR